MCRPQAAALLAPIYARTHQMARPGRSSRWLPTILPTWRPRISRRPSRPSGRHRAALGWLRRMHGEYLEAQIANDPRFAGLRRELAGTLAQKAG